MTSGRTNPIVNRSALLLLALPVALVACKGGDPLRVTRSVCPAVAVLNHTGDVTLFNPAGSRDADAIDVQASITNLRTQCNETGPQIVSQISFDVVARRASAAGARDVTLPFFATVVRSGDQILSKQMGSVTLRFADGQLRATAPAAARAQIDRAQTILPADINAKITKERKPGDADAAIDPMADPKVKAALRNASFETLVGFQLDEAGLAYNVTR